MSQASVDLFPRFQHIGSLDQLSIPRPHREAEATPENLQWTQRFEFALDTP